MSESSPAPGAPPESTPGDQPVRDKPSSGRAILDGILEGNSVVVTFLAIVTAIVLGGLLIAFTNQNVLNAWGVFFSHPGQAIASAWDTASGAYVAIFEGSIFNPHTVASLFQQKSMSVALHDGTISAGFNPLSGAAVFAAPLILAGLSVAIAFQTGLFNIGGESQWIGGAILATWLGYGGRHPGVFHVVSSGVGGL